MKCINSYNFNCSNKAKELEINNVNLVFSNITIVHTVLKFLALLKI